MDAHRLRLRLGLLSGTYVQITGIVAIERNYRLATRGQLNLILRPKSGNDLDRIWGRHSGRRGKSISLSWLLYAADTGISSGAAVDDNKGRSLPSKSCQEQ